MRRRGNLEDGIWHFPFSLVFIYGQPKLRVNVSGVGKCPFVSYLEPQEYSRGEGGYGLSSASNEGEELMGLSPHSCEVFFTICHPWN